MKKLLCVMSIVILILLTGCKEDSALTDIDQPYKTTTLMTSYAKPPQSKYDDFKDLFSEGIDEKTIQEKFELVKEVGTDRSSILTMSLVEYENGKFLLVSLVHDSATGKYFIHDVKEVPEEVQTVFKENFGD